MKEALQLLKTGTKDYQKTQTFINETKYLFKGAKVYDT